MRTPRERTGAQKGTTLASENVTPSVSDSNPPSKPRTVTVTPELSMRRSEGGAGDRFELRAQMATPGGPVRLLRAELDREDFASLVTGGTVVCLVEVPDGPAVDAPAKG